MIRLNRPRIAVMAHKGAGIRVRAAGRPALQSLFNVRNRKTNGERVRAGGNE